MRLTGRLVSLLSGTISGWLVVGLMTLVMVEVFTRYVGHNPLRLADEIGAYLLIFIIFMGLAYTWKEQAHIRIEAALSRMPMRFVKWMRFFTLVIALIFSLVLTKAAFDVVSFSFKMSLKSASRLQVPEGYIQIFILIGCGLLFVQLVSEVVKAARALGSQERQNS